MPVIDFHVHAARPEDYHPWVVEWMQSLLKESSLEKFRRLMTPAGLLSLMDDCGVAKSVILADMHPKTVGVVTNEFVAEFEQACKARGVRLFVLPPRSPKLNGCVERANRTHTEEFYDVYPMVYTVAGIRAAQSEWEEIYNTVRPHQALSYLTPLQYLQRRGILGKEDVSPRY